MLATRLGYRTARPVMRGFSLVTHFSKSSTKTVKGLFDVAREVHELVESLTKSRLSNVPYRARYEARDRETDDKLASLADACTVGGHRAAVHFGDPSNESEANSKAVL